MQIIKATLADFEAVQDFYGSLIDERRQAGHTITWVKGVYPSAEILHEALERGELYLGMVDEEMAASMILNCRTNEGYGDAPWRVDAREDEFMVIHAGCAPALWRPWPGCTHGGGRAGPRSRS